MSSYGTAFIGALITALFLIHLSCYKNMIFSFFQANHTKSYKKHNCGVEKDSIACQKIFRNHCSKGNWPDQLVDYWKKSVLSPFLSLRNSVEKEATIGTVIQFILHSGKTSKKNLTNCLNKINLKNKIRFWPYFTAAVVLSCFLSLCPAWLNSSLIQRLWIKIRGFQNVSTFYILDVFYFRMEKCL